jgi:hypothetical protein
MKLALRADPKAIQRAVLRIRGQNVLLDSDLSLLYGVNVKALNQAVKRNSLRFPPDFMFQLDAAEAAPLRSQIVTAKQGRGGRRTPPYAFTEQGVAMLSSVLRSSKVGDRRPTTRLAASTEGSIPPLAARLPLAVVRQEPIRVVVLSS